MAERPSAREVREWIEIAESDLRSARLLLDADPPEPRAAAFHCQQAGEKFLKGLLAYHGESPPRIHALPPLVDLAAGIDLELTALRPSANALTPFAVEPRYPLTSQTYSAEQVRDALQHAERIRDAVLARLPEADTNDPDA